MSRRLLVLMLAGSLMVPALGATPLNTLSQQNEEPNDDRESAVHLNFANTSIEGISEAGTYYIRISGISPKVGFTPYSLTISEKKTEPSSNSSDGVDEEIDENETVTPDSSSKSEAGESNDNDEQTRQGTTLTGETTTIPSRQKTVEIKSTGDERAEYRFRIYGNVTYGDNANPVKAEFPDEIDGGSVFGSVAEGGTDTYKLSGYLIDFSVDGSAKMYVNGEQVTPETPEDQTQYMNKLVISGKDVEHRATYQFSVTGELQRMSSDPDVNMTNGHVNGSVSSENDTYRYTGRIKNFSYSGAPRVFVKGEEVEPAVLAGEKPSTTAVTTSVQSTTTRSVSTPVETDRPTSQTGTTGPGFGIVAVALAVIGAAIVSIRRSKNS